MSLLSSLGISTEHATATTGSVSHQQGDIMSIFPMLILLIVVFYFLMIRPQRKRAKAQRELIDKISVGDEIVTIGGIVGRVAKLKHTFIILDISKEVQMMMRKAAIESVLPKGTMDDS